MQQRLRHVLAVLCSIAAVDAPQLYTLPDRKFRALYPRSRGARILCFYFILQSNRIGRLPEEMGALARLKTLDVSNNELAELPAALGYLPELNRLAVEGNPLKSIRRSIISGPISSFKVGFDCCTTRF